MPRKHLWLWKIYLAFMLVFAVKSTYYLLMPDSQSFFYYFILRAFDPIFYAVYTAHVMQVLLSVIHWIPVFLYVYRIRFLSSEFWKSLFILRCIFEITGHSYATNSLVALYHRKPKICLTIFIILIIPHIPSYMVCYWYAFRRENCLRRPRSSTRRV
ncbi:MAG: hypothetical protein KAS66_12225 [Candidatus Omnitrophica bacterium]|nr:hypothetical protein [Candidatus Omnitrophota bacterium]